MSITETDVGAFLNVNLSKTQEIMIIKVEISEETMARMLTGKRVEGTIGYDLMTGKKTFNAFHRRRHDHHKDELLGKLPWGWVKESKENQKRYTSFPKNMSLEEKLALMDRDNEMAKAVLIERELELIEFC